MQRKYVKAFCIAEIPKRVPYLARVFLLLFLLSDDSSTNESSSVGIVLYTVEPISGIFPFR